jgi:hypothetical protein
MPLAVYRELAAHLRQVGATVELLPQASQTFDYQQSQVGGLVLRYLPQNSPQSLPDSEPYLQQILAYYSQQYKPSSVATGTLSPE